MRSMTPEQIAEHDRIQRRIWLASRAIARAAKAKDLAALAKAEARMKKATDARDAFVASLGVAKQYPPPPRRILYKYEARWSGPSGSGVHRFELEMALDRIEVSGPHWRTTAVLRNEGAPPDNARAPADSVGVAWFAVAEYIKNGTIVVLSDEEEEHAHV